MGVDRRAQNARRDGFEAMRRLAIKAFERIGRQDMNGLTAAQIMRELNGPVAPS